jgi:hypothetical protein
MDPNIEADEAKTMNEAQLKDHIKKLFTDHFKYLQGIEAKKKTPASGETAYEPEYPEYNLEEIVDDLDTMLNQITDEILNTPEFIKGTANYYDVYQKAWGLYRDKVMEKASGEDGEMMREDASWYLKSGVMTSGRGAPGIYRDGQLVRLPSYQYEGGRTPRYTKEQLKEWRGNIGADPDPEASFIIREVTKRRNALTGTFGEGYRQRHPFATQAEYGAAMDEAALHGMPEEARQVYFAQVVSKRPRDISGSRERETAGEHEGVDPVRKQQIEVMARDLSLNREFADKFSRYTDEYEKSNLSLFQNNRDLADKETYRSTTTNSLYEKYQKVKPFEEAMAKYDTEPLRKAIIDAQLPGGSVATITAAEPDFFKDLAAHFKEYLGGYYTLLNTYLKRMGVSKNDMLEQIAQEIQRPDIASTAREF